MAIRSESSIKYIFNQEDRKEKEMKNKFLNLFAVVVSTFAVAHCVGMSIHAEENAEPIIDISADVLNENESEPTEVVEDDSVQEVSVVVAEEETTFEDIQTEVDITDATVTSTDEEISTSIDNELVSTSIDNELDDGCSPTSREQLGVYWQFANFKHNR